MIEPDYGKVSVTPTSSFFSKNGLFGSWPTQDDIQALVDWGVDVIVNLAFSTEKKVKPYAVPVDKHVEVINFPIRDRSVPENKIDFCSLVVQICNVLSKGKKVYIHCKGGHGRSGLLVASVIAYKTGMSADEAIALTSKYHSDRQVMHQRWRVIGSPQTNYQKTFVRNLFYTVEIEVFFCKHVVPKLDSKMEKCLNCFLLQTHLSRIIGPKGSSLMRLREKLMKSCKT